MLSHGHPDHIGGVIENGKPLFANARYAIGGTEYDFWSPAGKHTGDLEKFSSLFRDLMVPLAEKTTFLKPGDDVAAGIRAVEAFGHTPGHLAFHIDGGGKELFWFGDIAHHQVASLARPDWHCVFDVDPEKASETRARVLEMLAADRVAVCGYHMPFPSIGYVERLPSRGYRWLPHSTSSIFEIDGSEFERPERTDGKVARSGQFYLVPEFYFVQALPSFSAFSCAFSSW